MSNSLGLESGVVRLVAYDPAWPELFTVEAERIASGVCAPGLAELAIEHVGSTSVPRLAAKPVLDVLAGRDPDIPAGDYVPVLVGLGFRHRGDGGLPGREFFRRGEPRSHHVHLVEHGGRYWRDYVTFRDALRADAALAEAYQALKAALAAQFPRDREAYIEGKTAFVQRVLGRPAKGSGPSVGQTT